MRYAVLACALFAGACGKPAEGATADTGATVTGQARFADAPTDQDGAHLDPAAPVALRGALWLTLRGPADIDDDCPDKSAGTYVATYTGPALVDHGELRASLAPAQQPALRTESGCAVTRADVHGFSDASLTLELPTSGAACTSFCGAHARAGGYDRCLGAGDEATCRATSEASAGPACEQACPQSAAITGAGQIDAGQLPTLDAEALERGALGDLQVTVQLDHLVDGNRQPVAIP